MQNQDDIQQIHTKIQIIPRKRHKKCKNRTNTHGNSTKHDKITQYGTKTTKRKHNIHRRIKTKNTKK